MIKTCRACRNELPITDFSTRPRTKDGYSPICDACRRAVYLPWNKKNVSPRPGYVYILSADNDMYKIGVGCSADGRHREVCAQSPVPVRLLYSSFFPNASVIERNLHYLSREYHSHYEWYRMPNDFVTHLLSSLQSWQPKAVEM